MTAHSLSSGLRSPILPLGLAFVAAIASADFLAYDAHIGLGFALFLLGLPVWAGLSAAVSPSRADWMRAVALQIAAIAPLLGQANVLTIGIALVGTLAVCLMQRGALGADWLGRLSEVTVQAVCAPFRFVPALMLLGGSVMRSSPRASILVWALPAAFAAAFVALFADANPVLEKAFAAIDLVELLDAIFSERVWFWIWMAIFSAPFLHPAVRQAPKVQALLSAAKFLRTMPDDEAVLRKRFTEAGFAGRCLMLFNTVFALQTLSDLVYLYAGFALPDGMGYAEYAHRGAYPLLATAVLAGLFVIWTTRPDGPAATSPLVTRLVLLWVAQNLLLLVSSVVRLDLYVDAMGLTYWRVSAGIWMALTGLGFALILVRGFRGLSLGWLTGANALALLATLYVAGFVNWADVIARSQLERDGASYRSALWYVRGIGPEALPALTEHRAALWAKLPEPDRCELHRVEQTLRQRLRWAVDGSGQKHAYEWRSMTRRRFALEAIAARSYPERPKFCAKATR